jgi:hypothetical protein
MRHLGDARELLPSLIKSSIALLAMGWRAPCSSPSLTTIAPIIVSSVCVCVCVCVFALLAVMHVRTLGGQSQCCSHTGCEHESADLSHWVAAMVVMMTMMDIMLWL